MEDYSEQLEQQVKQIEKLINETEGRIRENTAHENKRICTTNLKKGYQYYELCKDRKRKYIPKNRIALAKAVAQRDYDTEVKKKLVDTRYKIMRFIKIYDIASIENVYNNLCEARKALVKPIIPTDENYIQEWKSTHCGHQNEYPMSAIYLTNQGEQVRSKSEKILADLFLKHKIPYTYEPLVTLKNGKRLYPDFALLNIRTRKTIFWEHFGLVSDGEYASKAFAKLCEYEDIGLEVGKDILFSTESDSQPFDQKKIEHKIVKYLH